MKKLFGFTQAHRAPLKTNLLRRICSSRAAEINNNNNQILVKFNCRIRAGGQTRGFSPQLKARSLTATILSAHFVASYKQNIAGVEVRERGSLYVYTYVYVYIHTYIYDRHVEVLGVDIFRGATEIDNNNNKILEKFNCKRSTGHTHTHTTAEQTTLTRTQSEQRRNGQLQNEQALVCLSTK